jgi:hypothetical protein
MPSCLLPTVIYKCLLCGKKGMKKDFIVSRIEAAQDGTPYVYVTFSDPNAYKSGVDAGKQQNPFGSNVFTSPEDLMKNLPKAIGDISKMMGTSGGGGIGGGGLTDSPTFKLSMKEYEDMAIKVGDKLTIEVKKSDSSGI